MWQALARYLGSSTTASSREEAETIIIAEMNDGGAMWVHEQINLGGSERQRCAWLLNKTRIMPDTPRNLGLRISVRKSSADE